MKKITLLFSFFPMLLAAQTVTTISPNSGVTDDLIFSLDGHLLGADYTGSAVFKVTLPDGMPTVFSDGHNTPNGLELHPDGTLYMADNQGNKIVKIYPDGSSETFVDFFNPSGLIFEQGSDTLIATSYSGDKMVKIAPDGSMVDWSVGGELTGGPVGLCYDGEGKLYVGNFDDRKITQILPDGTQVPVTQGPTSGWLGFIECANGYIYGTLYSTHKIFRYDLNGGGSPEVILGSTAGNTDGGPGEAQFNAPNGILATPSGDTLYISDFNTSNIRMITGLAGPASSAEEVGGMSGFDFSPNPFRGAGRVLFELSEPTVATVELYDMEGKSIRHIMENKKLAAGKHEFEIKEFGLLPGIYHLVLRLEDGRVFSEKINAL